MQVILRPEEFAHRIDVATPISHNDRVFPSWDRGLWRDRFCPVRPKHSQAAMFLHERSEGPISEIPVVHPGPFLAQKRPKAGTFNESADQ